MRGHGGTARAQQPSRAWLAHRPGFGGPRRRGGPGACGRPTGSCRSGSGSPWISLPSSST